MNELDKLGQWLNGTARGIPQSILNRGVDEIKDFASKSFEDLVRERKALVGARSDLELFCALDIEVMLTPQGSLGYFVRNVLSGLGFGLMSHASTDALDATLAQVLAAVPSFLASNDGDQQS